jgi:uncharacterized protein (UPF0248 family)
VNADNHPTDEDIIIVSAIALDPRTAMWAREMRIGHKVVENPMLAEVYSVVYGNVNIMSSPLDELRRRPFSPACRFANLEAALLHYNAECWTANDGLLSMFQRLCWQRFDRWGIDVLEWATKRVKAGDRGESLRRAAIVLSFASSEIPEHRIVWVYNPDTFERCDHV